MVVIRFRSIAREHSRQSFESSSSKIRSDWSGAAPKRAKAAQFNTIAAPKRQNDLVEESFRRCLDMPAVEPAVLLANTVTNSDWIVDRLPRSILMKPPFGRGRAPSAARPSTLSDIQ
jgi:hypothetical protein